MWFDGLKIAANSDRTPNTWWTQRQPQIRVKLDVRLVNRYAYYCSILMVRFSSSSNQHRHWVTWAAAHQAVHRPRTQSHIIVHKSIRRLASHRHSKVYKSQTLRWTMNHRVTTTYNHHRRHLRFVVVPSEQNLSYVQFAFSAHGTDGKLIEILFVSFSVHTAYWRNKFSRRSNKLSASGASASE